MNSRRLLIRSPRRRGRASSDLQYPPRFWLGGPDDQVPLVPNAVPGNVGSYAASPNPSRIRLTPVEIAQDLRSGESTTTRPSLLIFPASYLALARFSISLRYSWKTSRLSAWPDP